ncbi:hypothetical protein EVAR_57672_1 [Eumeta japonica]|uniref:Uncharacterized protein n=1 Tax=Eumeta variegata TaxID=151549 RepID=A0A4C1YKQ0_EUMVA|nr:hypothetical protein EVAR_57672_1 [Eumeta japonica]
MGGGVVKQPVTRHQTTIIKYNTIYVRVHTGPILGRASTQINNVVEHSTVSGGRVRNAPSVGRIGVPFVSACGGAVRTSTASETRRPTPEYSITTNTCSSLQGYPPRPRNNDGNIPSF